ncbi:MAG: hypothetical protein P4L87_10570 [Formivibrio sp.]|nr:hypothetical protein [Formivibrio sp.]
MLSLDDLLIAYTTLPNHHSSYGRILEAPVHEREQELRVHITDLTATVAKLENWIDEQRTIALEFARYCQLAVCSAWMWR